MLRYLGFLISALVFLVAPVRADPEDSWNLVAGMSYLHDNNLFRSPDGFESSDEIIGTTYGVKVNKQYSLQRFLVDVIFTDYQYQKNDYLNYVGKNLGATWLWSLTPDLTGNLSAKYDEALNSFADYRGRARNLRTTESYRFDLDWNFWGRFRLVGGVNRYDVANSEVFLAESDYSANAVEYGFKYQTPTNNSLTFMVRNQKGEYANRQINPFALIDTGFEQDDLEARFVWGNGGKSRFNGRLAYIDRQHDNYAVRDYSGWVGSLDYVWDISGKVRVSTGVRQDLNSYQTAQSSYYRARSFNITPIWQISAKTALRARYNRENRDYYGELIPALGGREDKADQALIAVDWSPMRTLTVSASVQKEKRSTNRQFQGFADQTAVVSANLVF